MQDQFEFGPCQEALAECDSDSWFGGWGFLFDYASADPVGCNFGEEEPVFGASVVENDDAAAGFEAEDVCDLTCLVAG